MGVSFLGGALVVDYQVIAERGCPKYGEGAFCMLLIITILCATVLCCDGQCSGLVGGVRMFKNFF